MRAAERTLQQILHSPDQYVIPVFQRYYVWKEKNWKQLWDDIMLLLERPEETSRHFMGALVCVPERHMPGIVPAYQLIDGQQRLATLSILFCVVRDAATRLGSDTLAAEIEQTYLIQPFHQGRERYKVFPRLRDRGSYLALVDRNVAGASGRLLEAYYYLSRQLQDERLSDADERLRSLFTTLHSRLDFVLINLDGENPYKIFRSLNSLGVDLEQGDLIRNHVFMAIPIDEQDAFDDRQWLPLESHFETDHTPDGKLLAAFFRDFLMRRGTYVGQNAIFEAFENAYPLLPSFRPTELVADLECAARHYDIIQGRANHTSRDVDRAIGAVRSLNVTTAYPLLLALLDAHEAGRLSLEDLVQCLLAIAGFVLRRYVCNEQTRAYGRWFCSACRILGDSPLANLTAFFWDKGWPSDNVFIPTFQHFNLYNGDYARAVLKGIESSIQVASEPVVLTGCSIEHVMPQTIQDDENGREWMADLGARWREIHDQWLHTPGNLTLVGSNYNSEISNKPFRVKKPKLADSRVYLNKYFSRPDPNVWNEDAMMERGLQLAQRAAQKWKGPG